MNTKTITLGKLPFTAVLHRRWVIVIGAMAAAIAVWTVIDPLMGVDLEVKTAGGSSQQVSHLVVGSILLFGLARTTRQP